MLRIFRDDGKQSLVIPELLRRCATMSGIQENRSAELKRSLDPAIKSRDDITLSVMPRFNRGIQTFVIPAKAGIQ